MTRGNQSPHIHRPSPIPPPPSGYVELHCHSVFSLLDGASEPEALLDRARALGMPALALTDHDDLGGAVRFATAARELGIGGIIGAELTVLVDDVRTHLVVLAESREGYGNIASLITRARLDTLRGEPAVSLDTLAAHARGLFALTGCPAGWVPRRLAAGDPDGACEAAATLLDLFEGRLAIECWDHRLPEERELVRQLIPLARSLGIPWVVTNDVHYALPTGRLVHDVLGAIRHQRSLDEMGTRLRPNGEWYLRSAAQMRRRWQLDDSGLRASLGIAERCTFRLEELKPTLPAFPLPPGVTADEYLARLVEQGARERLAPQWPERVGRSVERGVQGVERRAWSAERRAPSMADHESRHTNHESRVTSHEFTDLPPRYQRQVAHELDLIRRLGLAGYFLIVWDIVRYARRAGILCQGRGSAANSVVCYCLGITAIDPVKMELLFERFLSAERPEAPDIDIDFAHRDREHVLQYVYDRYGREHAAMVCEHITYRGKSAVRDAARVLGFSVEQANVLSTLADRFSAEATADALRSGASAEQMAGRHYDLDPQSDRPAVKDDPRRKKEEWTAEKLLGSRAIESRVTNHESQPATRVTSHESRPNGADPTPPSPLAPRPSPITSSGLDPDDHRVKMLPEIIAGLHNAPRHRSIHVGGFVLTREPLRTVVPIEPASMPGRTVIQWERDDLDPAGLVKIDLLGLGMLTVLQDCLKYIRATRGVTIDLGTIDMTDQAVYDDMCRADTVGVFQIESRAQMNTLPRLQPRCFYDLVVEVALIRPGPIQGDMVNPYLRRRLGEEAVTFAHPSLEPALKRTLGVPLFQEQGMQVAVTAAGFTPGEADVLRRAMGHKRSRERMAAICAKLIEGMARNGIDEETAKRIYNQINAFADYGFPESHAASFALIVYASAYLRHYYAAEFLAAMLNAQPMGFYSVGTLIEDAKRHGVVVRPIDLTRSAWHHALEFANGDMVVPVDQAIGVVARRERRAVSDERRALSAEGRAQSDERRGQSAERGGGERGAVENDSPNPEPRTPGPRPQSPPVVRLGLRLVRGLGTATRETIEAAMRAGPFVDIADFVKRARVDQGAVRALCEAGAFDTMVADVPPDERRRVALWRALDALRGEAGPLAPRARAGRGASSAGRRAQSAVDTARNVEGSTTESRVTSHESRPDHHEPRPVQFPPMSRIELTDADYRMTGLSLNGHPMHHIRHLLEPNAVRTADDLMRNGRDGERVGHAGLAICRQRPGTAKGFVFLSLEDETGILNVVVTPKRFERQALLISNSPLLLVRGTLQVEHGVVNLRGESFQALKADAGESWAKGHDFH